MFQIGQERLKLVQGLYVANVRNRLRELETPDDDLQKRWIWELIQNAKDCSKEAKNNIQDTDQIPFKRVNQGVDIKIIYDVSQNLVIFKHNGFPFTNETLDSLMYKITTKDDDENSTGRFGTGFMTSHTLSRVVVIHAPFLLHANDSWERSYIEATVFREGSTDKQLAQEFLEMEKSKKKFDYDPNNEEHNWTSFTYKLTSDLGINSAKLGIQSFRENIMKLLLFCDDINSIQLNDENPIFSSSVSNNKNLTKSLIKQNIFDNLQVIGKTITYLDECHFIVASVEQPDEQYTQKFSKSHNKECQNKKIRFSIAFEIDSNKNLVNLEPNQTCLFCTFPLIGSSKYQLPFLLDSPIFETKTERDGIILDGKEFDSDNILTNTGLNFLILNSSIKLFKIILSWLIQDNYTNFACFSNGLKYNNTTIESMKPFLNKLRSILEASPLVHNSSNDISQLNEIIILDFTNIKNPKTFHDLASKLYTNVASFDECNQWQNKTWESISILTYETFIKHIISIGSNTPFVPKNNFHNYVISQELFKNGLLSLEDYDFDFLNEFYSFILFEESGNPEEESIFLRYKIVLNLNNKFALLSSLKSNSNCSPDFNEVMKMFNSWGDKIIHPRIISFQSKIDKITNNDATQEITNFFYERQNDIQSLLSFVRFVIKDDDRRSKMYQVSQLFYDVPQQIIIEDVDENLWEYSDSLLLKLINQKINNMKGKTVDKSNLESYNSFYELYQRHFTNNNFLVPNFKLILVEKRKLGKISTNISPVLLDKLGPFIKFDLYAHPLITSVNFSNTYEISNLMNTINSDDFFAHNGFIYEDRLFSVLGIMPPKTNHRLFEFQTKIIELAQLFFCKDIKMIETPIVDELFWKRANEIVLDCVEDTLHQYHDISTLKECLVKDEKIIFANLNMYFEILSSDYSNRRKKALVPNYKGVFRPADKIYFSKGISETLFDLFNLMRPEGDIRDEYAHPNIVCNFLQVVDFKQFLTEISENLSDEQLISNSEILRAISKLNVPNLEENENEDKTNENEILLQKLYVANIKNRLTEIQNPNENDKKRWPWELIQNAKDSLFSPSNIDGQGKVKIYIEINKNPKNNHYTQVIFSHDGPAFTDNSFIGLLYKISQEKENKETTGRFGTGFVSTHVLSKIVEITGNKIDQHNKMVGFSATMYREGIKDDEIIRDFKEMQKSQKFYPKLFPRTTFKYEISSDQSRKCVELGLNHLKSHIPEVLINCPQIKELVLIENGIKTKYTLTKEINKAFFIYNIFINKSLFKRFILVKDKINDINISVEIDDQQMIIPINNEMENIFVSFPLVGSREHILPFYINSPNFEPSTERNALILDGEEEINGKVTTTKINRTLLLQSCDLFNNLISALKERKIKNIYELSRGLVLSQKPYSSFDMEWYQTVFLEKLRNTLANNITVVTSSGNEILLKDAYLPSKEIDPEILPQFIRLVERYCSNIVCEEDAILWKDRQWKDLNIVVIDGLMGEAECDQSLLNEGQLPYLNELLGFVWNCLNDKNILYEFRLIPDMNYNIHSLSKESEEFDMKESKTVPDQIIELMESIQIPWRSTHMNNSIDSITLPEDKVVDAESRIIEKIKEDNSMCFELMKFILEDNEFRLNMFDFVRELEFIDICEPVIINDISSSIWDFADNYVFHQIIEKISKFDSEKVSESLNFFNRFLPVFLNHYQKDEEFINSVEIFPNANCKLRKLSDLQNKIECFHDYLNQITIEFCKKDFNDDILHPEINEVIKSKNTESISSFMSQIKQIIANKDVDQEIKIKIAELIISLCPQEKEGSVSTEIKQRQLFTLYHDLINPKIEQVLIDSNYFSIYYWKSSNDILILHMCQKVEETETLEKFKETFSIEDDVICFNFLNSLYTFAEALVDAHKIIPNQNGVFKLRKELKQDLGIKKDWLDCINYLKPQLINIYEFADHRVNINGLSRISIMGFYSELNKMFNDALKKPEIDTKVIDMIKQITLIDEASIIDMIASKDMDEDQKARIRILQDAHVLFLKNRLRELDSPSDKDFQRWPFELIQNANDTLFNNKENLENDLKVKITFEFCGDKVIFSHNGSPFTNETFFALLYQCSEQKDNSKKATGKFGTGFMSTLVLSRIIKLSGDIQKQDKLTGFNVTIHRDGSSREELKECVHKMERSIERNLEPRNMTSFEYILPEKQQPIANYYYSNSQKAYAEGLRSLKRYIGLTLLLNPTIESVTIKTAKETVTYIANHEDGPIQTISIISDKYKPDLERFVRFDSIENFNESKEIKINCLLPIDTTKNNLVFKHYPTVLFLSYPLIGLDDFRSPIIINSPDFEPEKERDKIIIQKVDEDAEESNESLINKFIITKSVDIFIKMVHYVIDNNFNSLYYISVGLRFPHSNEFIKENFVDKMRDVVLSSNVFETSSGFRPASEILFPIIGDYNCFNDYDQKSINATEFRKDRDNEFFSLVSRLSIDNKYCISHQIYSEWVTLLWTDFPSKITFEELIKIVSEYDNASDIKLTENDETNDDSQIVFIKDVISFTEKMTNCDNFFCNYKLLINANKDLVTKDKVYNFKLLPVFVQMLDDVGYDYKKMCLHDEVKFLIEDNKIEFNLFGNASAIECIKDYLTNENSSSLMKYCVENSSHRESMFKYTNLFLNKSIEKVPIPASVASVSEIKVRLAEMFNHADSKVIKLIISKIHGFDIENNIDLYKEFVIFLKTNLSYDIFDQSRIFPNQLFEICYSDDLHFDYIKDGNVKEIIRSFFGIDLKRILIHDDFAGVIKLKNPFGFQTVSHSILDRFPAERLKNQINSKNLQQRFKLYSVIFEYSSQDERPREAVKILKFFLNFKEEVALHGNDDEDNAWSHDFAKSVSQIAMSEVSSFISQYDSLSELQFNIIKNSKNSSNNNDNNNDNNDNNNIDNDDDNNKNNDEICSNGNNNNENNNNNNDSNDNSNDDDNDNNDNNNDNNDNNNDNNDNNNDNNDNNNDNNDNNNDDDDYESSEFTNKIFDHLSILYNFTIDGKIFPNRNNDFITIESANLLHDDQLEDDVMNTLLQFLIRFRGSSEINESILHEKIDVSENEALKKNIHFIDLKFMTDNIMEAIQSNPNKESKQFKELNIEFLKFINSIEKLKVAFSALIEGEMHGFFNEFLNYLSQNSEESQDIGYKGEALVYELLNDSGNYSDVVWLARSEEETQLKVTLNNGHTYYINETGEHYDIYAEDDDNNKYYFEVKSTKAGTEDNKFKFCLRKEQLKMAKEMEDPKSHFVLALVNDVCGSPDILFFEKKSFK